MPGIDILPDDEAQQIVASVAGVIEAELPLDRLRGGQPASLTAEQWRMAGEMGWIGLSLPAEHGGVGLTITEEALVHREMGRMLVTPSVAATAIAAQLAIGRGGAELDDYRMGRRHAAFAIDRGADRLLVDAGDAAELLVIDARGMVLALRGPASPVEAMDPTLPMERSPSGDANVVDDAMARHAILLLSAQLSGIADAAARMATDYAGIRQQFGKPIGSFQAIAHACADAAMRAEAANAQMLFASIALRDGRGDAAFQVACLARVAADAAFRNATANIHVHGGMGYSAEVHAHLYLKRALVLGRLVAPLAADPVSLLGKGAVLE